MSMLAVKLRRDLRAYWPRLTLMVIAVAVSLTVFGGVLLAWSGIGRETPYAYANTQPASATILFDRGIDAGQMAAIAAEARSRPGIIEAAGRTQFSTDIDVNGQARDIGLQVIVTAADDPMRIATFEVLDGGAWPPPAGEILIRRDSLELLGVRVGDTVTVTPPGGRPTRLRVAATVYEPSLSPSPQEQRGYGYLSTAALADTREASRLDQLKIQVADPGTTTPTRDRDVAVSGAQDIGRWLQATYGLTVREIQVPPPYAHPHQWQADALLLSLLGAAVAALLLSTILVANMLNNLFTRQIPQIGILKAVGARSGDIGRLYLSMTLLVAAAATLLAFPAAVVLGRAAVRALTGFLGIEPRSLASPWWTYLVVLAVGLGLPPLIALVPLVKTSRTTVRAAIDHHGGGAAPSPATGVVARLSRLDRVDRGLLMALRNTVRRPARFWLSVGLLACAGTAFVAGLSLNSGTQAIDDARKAQRTWDVDVRLATPTATDQVLAVVDNVPGVTAVQGWMQAQTGVAGPDQIPVTRTYPDQGHGSVSVTAIPPGAAERPPGDLLDGRWLNAGETGVVVLNQVTRKNTVPDVGVGDTVALIVNGRSTTWRVVGLVQEREGGHGGTYVTAEGFAQAIGQPLQTNQLRVVTDRHDEQTRRSFAAAVAKALSDAGIKVQSAASISRADAISAGHLGPVLLILLGVALPLGVVGVIGLASTMSANVLDRIREFGLMHAIGARPRTVRRIVVLEGMFLAVTSFVLTIAPALILIRILGDGLGNLFMSAPLPYRVSGLAVVSWLALVLLGAALATDAAANRAARLTVREALVYL